MVAVVSGSGLGLFGSSVTGLGGAGTSGPATLGRGGDRVEDGAERAFRHVAGMIGDGGVAVGGGVVPDLVTAGGLAVELKT